MGLNNAGIAYLSGLIRIHKKPLFLILLIQLGCAVLMSLQPFLFQRIVSLVMQGISSSLMSGGLKLVSALALLYLAIALLLAAGGAIACRFSSDLLKQIQVEFFKKLNQLPLQYFQHRPAGEFMTQFNTDVGQTQSLIAHLLPMALRESVIILTVIAILLMTCPPGLTAMAILVIVLTAVLMVKLNQILEGYARKQRTQWADINRVVNETVEGIDTLKLFSREKVRIRYFDDKTASFRRLSVIAGIIVSVFSPVIQLLSKIGGLLLILTACYLITREILKTDQFLLFFFYVGLLEASVSALINTLSNIQPQAVSAGKLSDFFEQFPEESAVVAASRSIDAPIDIEIRDLSFSYPGGRELFNRASLTVPARKITVIHGPSGSGKSTLINLLLRFYPPTAGMIRLASRDIGHFSRQELRTKIGVVTQFHYIFNETLKNNLAIARTGASDEAVLNALENAHLGDFVRRLPRGIHETLDPRGKGISGGEKQRICMARLLLKSSPIIILDEPWSNLDEFSRDLLIEIVNQWKSDATILILSHELPETLDVDHVYELVSEKGVFEAVQPNAPTIS